MKLELGIVTEENSWKSVEFLNKTSISKIIKEVLKSFPAFQNSIIEVAVLLTNDSKMQQLNSEFLGKDKPTNVLSFPDSELNKNDLPNKEYIYIGDIALGYETVKSEAIERSVSMYDHVVHLLVHGVLHLLGYDHQVEAEEVEMVELELKFLKNFGITSPY